MYAADGSKKPSFGGAAAFAVRGVAGAMRNCVASKQPGIPGSVITLCHCGLLNHATMSVSFGGEPYPTEVVPPAGSTLPKRIQLRSGGLGVPRPPATGAAGGL